MSSEQWRAMSRIVDALGMPVNNGTTVYHYDNLNPVWEDIAKACAESGWDMGSRAFQMPDAGHGDESWEQAQKNNVEIVELWMK